MAKSLQLLSLNHYVQDQNYVFVLSSSDLTLFKIVPTTSLTHCYISFSDGKKHRVSKILFNYLKPLSLGGSYLFSNLKIKPLFK